MRDLIRLQLLVLIFLASPGCTTLSRYSDPPRVSLVNILPLEMTAFEQRYRLTLRIQNPNDADLLVDAMDYTVEINDRKFADGVSDQQFSVPPHGERVIDVVVSSNLRDVLQQVRDKELDKLRWKLSGGLVIPGQLRKLPFEYSGSLE